MRRIPGLLFCAVTFFFFFNFIVFAADIQPLPPPQDVKCPVCGMFVAKYPDWVGEIIFKDQHVAYFDGAKDLFKYYFNLEKYEPHRRSQDIAAVFVTEYYDVKLIDAYEAFFVIGSDVYGPMGRELVPLGNAADADEFKRDHQGKQIVRFADVTPELIKTLD